MSFESLGLSAPILKAVAESGYDTPSPIQAEAIPAVMRRRDVMAAAQTGTGKTAAFTLPLLEQLSSEKPAPAKQCKVLILTPTRELAAQIKDNIAHYSKYLSVRTAVVFGGVKINPQINTLGRGCEILVATPGRLLDLHQQGAVKFDALQTLVLDEADRMLDMGFIHDIRRIVRVLPERRQTLMFSATFSADIRKLAKTLVQDPIEVSVAPPNSTAEKVEQWICPVDKKRKPALLAHLINENGWHQVLVFSRTKHGANKLSRFLDEAGIPSAPIHGNKSQNARLRALADFKAGKIQALVATDIAARGIDISHLPHVVNVDLPNVAEDYVHRIGRTARAGASGSAVSLVSADEVDQLRDIERLIRQNLRREIVEGFDPQHALPESGSPVRRPSQGKPQRRRPTGNNNGNRAPGSGDRQPARRRRRPSNQRKANAG